MAGIKVQPLSPGGKGGSAGGHSEAKLCTDRSFQTAAKVAEVWRDFADRRTWFSNLRIAHDGGFEEVHVLFTRDRFAWALLSLAFLVMNLYVLFYPNIDALASEPFLADIGVRRGYVINFVLQSLFNKGLNPTILLAILELLLLAVLLCRAVHSLRNAFSGKPAHRWHAIATGLWIVLPHLMTFSAMRLLNFVAPSILIPELSNEITSARNRGFERYGLPLVRFIAIRAIFAVVGFEAFMVKFLDTADKVMHNQDSGWNAMLLSIAFLNQMLGIVQVLPLMQERLFVYIFGGEDSFISEVEKAVQQVWCARLAKRIWEESVKKNRFPLLWFFAVMLAYSDIDFQRLTLNQRSVTVPSNSEAEDGQSCSLRISGSYEGAEEAGGDPDAWVLRRGRGGW